jgi:hypothetical protein
MKCWNKEKDLQGMLITSDGTSDGLGKDEDHRLLTYCGLSYCVG